MNKGETPYLQLPSKPENFKQLSSLNIIRVIAMFGISWYYT